MSYELVKGFVPFEMDIDADWSKLREEIEAMLKEEGEK